MFEAIRFRAGTMEQLESLRHGNGFVGFGGAAPPGRSRPPGRLQGLREKRRTEAGQGAGRGPGGPPHQNPFCRSWSSRAVLAFCLFQAVAVAATLAGNVLLVNSEQPSVKKGRDYSGVVVWLEPLNGMPDDPPAFRRAVMQQRNKTFIPHVMAVEVGTAVDFPNLDPIFHNAFSNYDGQVFDVHLYAPQTSKRVVFRRPG